MQITQLFVHPLKSGASLAVDRIDVQARGPADDRRWMVVDPEGRFITGRKLPKLVLVRARPLPGGLRLEAPGMPDIDIAEPGPDAERVEVSVWKDRLRAPLAARGADAWLSHWLGREARLVFMDADAQRPLPARHARPGDEVSFADGFPLLIVSRAAVDELGRRRGGPVEVERFRPNIVIDGCEAHAEDRWRRIRIGAIEFDLPTPCVRCVFTTIDPSTAVADPDGEPLRTLKGYRRLEPGVCFGVNMIARGTGALSVGDRVELLDTLD